MRRIDAHELETFRLVSERWIGKIGCDMRFSTAKRLFVFCHLILTDRVNASWHDALSFSRMGASMLLGDSRVLESEEARLRDDQIPDDALFAGR
jgi:hypothetical protein